MALFNPNDFEPDNDVDEVDEYPEMERYDGDGSDCKIDIRDNAVKELCTEYHRYHGDTDIKIVKVVRDFGKFPYLLVRFKNKAGIKYSSIDHCDRYMRFPKNDYYEVTSCEREHEKEMIEEFKTM